MGWAVGWDATHQRFRGYGVPAYCDAYANGCRAEIDRGLGSVCEGYDGICEDVDDLKKTLFVCGDHTCGDVNTDALPPEHPDWAHHVLTDDSWQRWRDENPARVAALAMRADA